MFIVLSGPGIKAHEVERDQNEVYFRNLVYFGEEGFQAWDL